MDVYMKRIYDVLSAAVIAVMLLSSCEMMVEEPADTISLANDANRELYFSGEEGSRSIVLVASTIWSAESDQEWCKPTPSEGLSTELKLTISVDRNDMAEERVACVTLKAGTAVLSIKVTQGEKSTMSVSDADYVVKSEGGTLEVTVSHNVDYKVKIPKAAKWIKEVKSKGLSNSVHVFEVEPNEDLDNRSAVITFVSDGGQYEEEVEVLQLRKDALVVSDSKYNVDASAGTLTFTVTSSDPLDVKVVGASWLRMVDSKAVETELTFAYDANTAQSTRTATIILSSGSATDQIEVEQKACPENLVFFIRHDGQSFTVPVFSSSFTGNILWGDDSSDPFGSVTSHRYGQAGEHSVMFDLYGEPDELEFTLKDIVGITEINLEKLR